MNYQGPGIYRHYKGGHYEVLGIALDEHTVDKGRPDTHNLGMKNVRLVIYRPLSPGSMIGPKGKEGFTDVTLWARNLHDFNMIVPAFRSAVSAKDEFVPRFRKISELNTRSRGIR